MESPGCPSWANSTSSRYPEKYWREELLKMKAGGVQVVSTYVFWIHHEEIEGQFDWTGQRDLRHFVELCHENGLYVYLRIGPWDHGEARNGGFPDWLLTKKIPLRRNDPEYLKYVSRFYGQIGSQVKGLLWQEGGPIVGVQIENEYGVTGPGAGAEHLAELKRLAIAAGIDPPLFSVTGWPGHDYPVHEVIPVSGGYPDDFWTSRLTDAPPNPVYLFSTDRKLSNMGDMAMGDPDGKIDLRHYPFFAAEQGGGMETSYHRRPLMQPDDICRADSDRARLRRQSLRLLHVPGRRQSCRQADHVAGVHRHRLPERPARCSPMISRRRWASTGRSASPFARSRACTCFFSPSARNWRP